MAFSASIQCMVERILDPIIKYFKENHHFAYVHVITEPSPRKILAVNNDTISVKSIIKKEISNVKQAQFQNALEN